MLLAVVCVISAGCGKPSVKSSEGTVRITATLFPQYDFARQIGGEYVEVSLLMPPGVESHSFEPTPADIVQIDSADLFLYTGPAMEPWAENILKGLRGGVKVLNVSGNVRLDETGEGEEEHGGHSHPYDPHIWTSPLNAKIMAQSIADSLKEVDPAHADEYEANAKSYLKKLDALDQRFREIVREGKREKMVFAGRFAFHYFAQEYGLECVSAYDSCSDETEPSARAVASIVDLVKMDGIPAVYYEELADPKIARSVAAETNTKMLLFHSCHNVSREDFEVGVSYLQLMEQNAENLKVGLN